MFRKLRFAYHMSALEKMIKENKNLEKTERFKRHLRAKNKILLETAREKRS